MKRVMVIGQPGSGKSTIARAIGKKTGLPVHHIDLIHWKAGWVERDKAEKITLAMEIQNRDEWVFEGGLGATKAHRLARADTLVCLDFPLWLRAWRVFKRTLIYYGQTRPDLPDGCPEQFNFEFWKWIWDTRTIGRAQNHKWMAQAGADVAVHHLKSPRDVRRFLATL